MTSAALCPLPRAFANRGGVVLGGAAGSAASVVFVAVSAFAVSTILVAASGLAWSAVPVAVAGGVSPGPAVSVVSGDSLSFGRLSRKSAATLTALIIFPFAYPGWMFFPWNFITTPSALNVSDSTSPLLEPSIV